MNRVRLLLCAAVGWLPLALSAQEPEQSAHFENHVRPLLAGQCFDCHSEDFSESNLRVDSLAGMLRGGLRGPAIVPGKPEESLLITALRHSERLQMPPKRKLKSAEIAHLAQWIADGAHWPGEAPPTTGADDPAAGVVFDESQLGYWSFQTPTAPEIPRVAETSWVRNPIDAFVLQRLEQAGFHPAPRADRRTLIRRASFELIGLPPTPEEVDAFVNDASPDAFGRMVDRLLDSPRYGERWGRHWLDVARYADSNGLDENLAYANAWRYRDYVIKSFNDDKPFDQFVREQIAGDLLLDEATSVEQRLDRLTATGFLCIGPKMLAEDDPVKLRMDIVDEQIDTVGRAFMGLTLGCARCHDHKFDPISTADYYGLAGVFQSTRTMDTFTVVARWHERPLATPEAEAAAEAHRRQLEQVRSDIAERQAEQYERLRTEARRNVGDYLLAAESLRRRDAALKRLSAWGDQTAETHPAGTIRLEAEDFARGNVLRDDSNYGKGVGVLVNRGETPNFTEYELDAGKGGTYRFEVRYAAAAARPTKLAINGEFVRDDIADGVTGTWYPDSQRWDIEGFVELEPGTNIVRLEQPKFFPHIDKLLFAPAETDAADWKLEPLNTEFRPWPALVAQWRTFLDQQAADPSADSPWSAFLETSAGDDREAIREIARAYGEMISERTTTDLPRNPAPPMDALARIDAVALAAALNSEAGPLAPNETWETAFPAEARTQLAELRTREQSLQETMPTFPTAMAVAELDQPEDVRVHYRGSHLTQGPIVPRGFPVVLVNEQSPKPETGSGRLELAHWLTSPDHPLTARVFVNRVWHWHFGRGLVRSPDNFGLLGEKPTHPELLDWLALRFIESGWKIKDLHRLILNSATWQMSTAYNEQFAEQDPENRLLWRRDRARLDAEAMRDSLLAISGQLDLTMGGSQLPTENRKYVTSTANVDPVVYDTNRRSVYLPIVRSALYDVFQAFDFADPSALSGERQTTTIAPQALFMMNSELVSKQTKLLAERLLSESSDNPSRLSRLYGLCYGRTPDDTELQRALSYIDQYQQRWQSDRPDETAQAELRAWQSFCRIILSSNEFAYCE
jgi:hypothetical protein